MYKIYYILFLFLTVSANAQKITTSVSADNETVAKNQPIVLTITINARAEKVQMPILNDFKIVSEPGNMKTYSEMVGIEGSSVENISQSYTCCIIPKFSGKFVIAPFICTIAGKELKTNEIKIKVEDRKVSYEDSASIAAKFSGVNSGYQGSNVEMKTAIDYNKTDKTLVPKENPVGTGVQKFEVVPQKKTMNVKAGDIFIITYDVYKEAPKAEFNGSIELIPFESVTGIVVIDGPVRQFKSSQNSTTKVQSGTAEVMIQAQAKGKYIFPSLRAKYGDVIVSSEAIEIIVE